MNSRRAEEFYCDPSGQGCGKYFKTFLRENMSGAYTIQCPACGHHHYRKIVKGLVTSDRDYKAKEHGEILLGLKATVRSTPWHDDPAFKRSLLKQLVRS